MPTPLLLVIEDAGLTRQLRFEQGPVSVGSEPSAQVSLQNAEAARVYGVFAESGSGWTYCDQGNSNGSLMNGVRVTAQTPIAVALGDRLTIGSALIVVSDGMGTVALPGAGRAGAAAMHALRLHVAGRGGAYAVIVANGGSLGRDPGSTVQIQDDRVSRHHAILERHDGGWTYTDNESRNGSVLDGRRLPPHVPVPLHEGAVLSLGGLEVRVEGIAAPAERPQLLDHTTAPGATSVTHAARPLHRPPTIGPGAVRVGRALDNDLVIADPHVSSYHLVARPTTNGVQIWDLDSLNGTTVDGVRIQETETGLDSQIELGGSATVTGRQLLARLAQALAPVRRPTAPHAEPLAVGRGLTRVVGHGKVILREFDFVVRRGQFVAIVGGSGTGKSTLVKVLNRYTPPDKGSLVAALNAHGEEEIGYVPQDDIVHRELPLRDAVVLSAAIRFPPGTPAQRIRHRADEVLSDLGLKELAKIPVGKLSGGQRKRAGVAVELMTSPALLILDEATSGLDPATERRMMELLRKLADTGTVGVVLVTHATANIDLCDTVAFLAPGGYEVFWGTPHEARTYFGIGERFDDIYLKIEEEGSPAVWRQRFVGSAAYAALQTSCDAAQADLQPAGPPPARQPEPGGRPLWQLRGLVNRYARTQLASWRTPLVMLLQVPLLLLLTRLIPEIGDGDVLTRLTAEGTPATLTSSLQLLFVLSLIMIWSGAFNSAREICKEGAILERERHAGIGSLPYVLSKVIVLGLLCLAQALILLFMVSLLWSTPEQGPGLLALAIAAFISVMGGVAMGLALSSLATTPDQAMALLPLILIPQLLLAGSNPTLGALGTGGNIVTTIIAARWAFGAFGNAMARSTYLSVAYGCPNGNDPRCGTFGQMDVPWLVSLLCLVVLSALLIGLTVYFAQRSRSRATG